MKQTLKRFRRSVAAALAVATIVSCSTEELVGGDENGGGIGAGDTREMVFNIAVPAGTPLSTRFIAEGSADDNKVSNLIFLFFGGNGQIMEHYSSILMSSAITKTGGNTYSVTVPVPVDPVATRAIVMANWVTGGMSSMEYLTSVFSGEYLVQVPQLDEFSYDAFPAGHSFTDRTNPHHLMGSESVAITENITIPLIRSLAAIDVDVTAPGFTLQEIRLTGVNSRARVLPSGTPDYENIPSVPAKITGNANAISYSVPPEKNTAYKGHIFVPETRLQGVIDDNFRNGDWKTQPTLLIKGALGTATPRWFRVNLRMNVDGRLRMVPIERNHRYTINIVGVSGKGYATSDEAYDARPADLIIEITETEDDDDLTAITYNGHYQLATNGPLDYDGRSQNGTLKILADNPGGWKITGVTGAAGWLTGLAVGTGGAADVKKELPFSLAENPSMTDSRMATVTLTAGVLTQEVEITQGPKPWLRIDTQPKPLVGGVLDEHTLSRPGPDSYGTSWYDLTIAATPFNSSEPITYTWYVENWRVGIVPVPAEWTSDGGRTVNLTWKQLSSTGFCGHFHCVVSLPGAESIISETVTIWPEGGGLG